MFVVFVGSLITTWLWIDALRGRGEAPAWFIGAVALWLWFTVLFANFAEAIAEGRSKAQANALRGDAPEGLGEAPARTEVTAAAFYTQAGRRTAQGQRRPRRSRRPHALRRRGHRRRGLGRRIGDHRRIRAGDPRIGRRLRFGDRRHAGAVRLDRRALHRRSRRDVRRPHDRDGRKREASQDAERNRARDLPRRADAGLPARDRHAAAVLDLQRRGARRRAAGDDHRADRAARLPDPDDDRRTAVGHRRGRHEPDAGRQRARDVGPRGGGCGRRRRAPARQDRHDHAGQSPGERVPAGPRGSTAGARRRRAARVARRRDAGGTQHRRPREDRVRLPRAPASPSCTRRSSPSPRRRA